MPQAAARQAPDIRRCSPLIYVWIYAWTQINTVDVSLVCIRRFLRKNFSEEISVYLGINNRSKCQQYPSPNYSLSFTNKENLKIRCHIPIIPQPETSAFPSVINESVLK